MDASHAVDNMLKEINSINGRYIRSYGKLVQALKVSAQISVLRDRLIQK